MRRPPDPDALRAALGLLTGWREPSVDEQTMRGMVVDAGRTVGLGRLFAAELDLAWGLLKGGELRVDMLLGDAGLLVRAVAGLDCGMPLTARDVGADAGAVLDRVGLLIARTGGT